MSPQAPPHHKSGFTKGSTPVTGKTSNGHSKVFILDTNVLLVDPAAIDNFEEHVVVVSMTVMEELDGLKRRSSTEYEARQTINRILDLTTRHRPGEPISLRSGGTFILDATVIGRRDIDNYDLTLDKPDNRLLALALHYKEDENYPDRVVIVTNDAAVRIKAHSLGIASEEYEAVNYRSRLDELYREPTMVELIGDDAAEWNSGQSVALKAASSGYIDEPVLVRSDDGAIRSGYTQDGILHPYGGLASDLIAPLNEQQELALQVLQDQRIRVAALVGQAGTGKTILALATAIQQKLLGTSPGKVYIFRPNDQLADDIGFLPGGLDEKFSPHKRAIRDAFEIIQTAVASSKKGKRLLDFDALTNEQGGGRMPILPINFIRGSTLHNSLVIIDEAQNFTPHQMKTLLTRAGRNTRIFITGDPDQIDNRFLSRRSCGLTHVIGKMWGHGIFACVNLTQGERSEIATLAAELL